MSHSGDGNRRLAAGNREDRPDGRASLGRSQIRRQDRSRFQPPVVMRETRMKITFLVGRPVPSPTALWRRIGSFARHFRKAGHEVDVVGLFSARDIGETPGRYASYGTTTREGVRVINLDVFFAPVLLIPLLAVLRPAVLVCSLPPGKPALFAFLHSKLVGTRLVIDIRDPWEDYLIGRAKPGISRWVHRQFKSLMSEIYRRSDLVVAVTAHLADALRARGVDTVTLVPNGAEIDVFRPYPKATVRQEIGLSEDDIVLIFSGSVGEYHRLDIVVKAMARLPEELRRRVKLALVGRDLPLRELEQLAEDLSLREQIVYLGVQSDKRRLAELLSAADIGLVPHDDNPLWKNVLPAKFFEYCACGLPVLATSFEDSMLSDMVREHGLGRTTPPLDERKLADAIAALATDSNLTRRMGEKARHTVATRFNRDEIAETFLRGLEALAPSTQTVGGEQP